MGTSDDIGAIEGFMLGATIGDALGLPYEGVSRRRVAALLGDEPLRHRLLFGYGLVSDDTEHMLMTAAAWRRSGGDPHVFARHLARRLRLWMLALPAATGLATARACGKLLVGVPPGRSGVRSAGNGPVMRCGVLGVLCTDETQLCDYVRAATRITHRDDRAEHGALAVALAARAARGDGDRTTMIAAYRESIRRRLPTGEMHRAISDTLGSVERGESTEDFVAAIGCERRVSGFVMHTVPAVLHLWLSEPSDFPAGIRRVILLGGDTDTTAAVLGGMIGARVSPSGLPQAWLDGIKDFPITPALVRRAAMAAGGRAAPMPILTPRSLARLPRNLLFLAIALAHAGRRLLPPYA